MKRTLSVLTEDHPGVLTRLSNLISRRGYNVESLSVARTHRPGLSRFTIVVEADETSSKQMIKQLEKLVEAVEVKDLTQGSFVERRMMLVKVRASPEERHNLLQTAEVFRSRVVDVGSDAIILEVTGDARTFRSARNGRERCSGLRTSRVRNGKRLKGEQNFKGGEFKWQICIMTRMRISNFSKARP